MPLTLSGRRVARDTAEHPSLTDIAVGLSRMPRFAGQTKQWFSVLDHTMFGLALIEEGSWAYRYDKRWWLLHDAHEAITGDIPTDVKHGEMRALQAELDVRIFGAFYPQWDPALNTEQEKRVKDLDNRCLRAESKVLKDHTIGGEPLGADVEILRSKLASPLVARGEWMGSRSAEAWLGLPPMMASQETHPLVRAYIARMLELM